jgi:uncharacterized protein (DUF697 family)
MPSVKLPLAPLAVFNLLRELRKTTSHRKPIALGGARSLVDALRRELVRDGEAWAVREATGSLEGVSALVYVLAGPVAAEDERMLRTADAGNVPIVVLGPDPREPIPYVLATDVLPLRGGEGFPLEELGRLLAGKLDEEATALAAALPTLRRPVAEALVARVARQNGMLAAAIFVPGVDFPVLTLNQLRLVLRLAAAYGQELDAQRVPEIVGVVGAGLGFRAVARQALGVIPVAGWAIQGGVAYTGTRALGEAAIRYFEATSGGGRSEAGTTGANRA